jgi:NAD(P)H-hydrate epimerase
MNPSSDRAPQLLNRRQVRAVDRIAIERHGMHSLVLMENAGRGCVDLLESLGINGRIDICCGKGNNGGDGFVIARHLLLRGHSVQVHYFDDPSDFSPDAAANFEILRRGAASLRRVTSDELTSHRLVQELATAEWIVDALLGTGAGGAPRFPYDEVIRQANSCSARRLAIDWPSGLDCDTGVAADPTFLADHTGTFVATKLGSRNPDAASFVGTLHVLDIGVLPQVVEEAAGG